MLIRVVHAIAIGFVAGLICLFIAAILPNLHVPVLTDIAHFFGAWAWPIGLVVGLLDFVSGGFGPSWGPRP